MKIIILLLFTFNLHSQEEKLDTNHIRNLIEIGNELITKDKVKSKELLDSAFEYSYRHTAHYWLALTYQNMGLYHFYNDSLVRASDYLELSARAFDDIKYFNDKAKSNIIYADLLYSIGRNEKAIEVLLKSYKDLEKLYPEYSNSINLKLSENYEKTDRGDSAEIFRTKFNPENEVLDFKLNLSEEKAKSVQEQSKVHELEMELEIEKMKSNLIIWFFAVVGGILFLIVLILSVKLYKVRKREFNANQRK